MPLAWNEIRQRAIKFTNEWTATESESADKQTFWNEFFEVFGIARKTVASFEAPVKKVSGHDGFIDLFWKGILIVEHKSRGGNLSKAQSQAFDYIQSLASEGRHKESPRYVIVSDFARIVLYDLEPEEQKDLPLFNNKRVAIAAEFPIQEFHKNIRPFAFIAGYKQQKLDPEDPANLEAAKMMADLHDALHAGGYTGHELRQFLVRILFCLFAEDTGIFSQPRQFELYLIHHTAQDGSDLGTRLARMFEILDTPPHKRQVNLDDDLKEFPYINGDLFKEHLSFADFNSDMRNALLTCCTFRWERISPAVFGSLFQEVMLPKERRQLGAHYTAEKNIMKVVRSLFLDDLREEFEHIKLLKSGRDKRLEEFHTRLGTLTFFDPACGCGNFLVITYRELRALELEVLQLTYGKQKEMALDDVNKLSRLNVDQMFGIEYEEFPARIAEVALWLVDHQMNVRLSEVFSQFYLRIPLRKSPHIHVGNALRIDWKTVLLPEKCSYVLGNPPFVGKHYQNKDQREDMVHVFGDFKNTGDIDYVVGWFYLAGKYIQNTQCKVGFVSTNSITQGEQVPLVWGLLFQTFHVKIHFAHRTFAWQSEARGKAHVHCVIIGFGLENLLAKRLYDYDLDEENPALEMVSNISPYLTPGPDVFISKRQKPLCGVQEMRCGNKPSDGGFLILTEEEKLEFVAKEPAAKAFLRKFLGSEEFINGNGRWCLWLEGASPNDIRSMPSVHERLEQVRAFRMKSSAEPTRRAASNPARFFFVSQPVGPYIAIPEVSSERRHYIPIGFLEPEVIASNKLYVIPSSDKYLFGVLCSAMHMAWVKPVSGRLKSDFQYSGTIVYNNFPWPESATPEQKQKVESAAQAVLDARAQFMAPAGEAANTLTLPSSPGGPAEKKDQSLVTSSATKRNCTLADLYDPISMPPILAKAHAELDRAVDRCYRKEPFPSDRARVEFLFKLYEQLTAPLLPPAVKKKRVQKGSKPAM